MIGGAYSSIDCCNNPASEGAYFGARNVKGWRLSWSSSYEHVFLNSVYDVFTSVHKKMVYFSTSLERERNLVKEILLLPIPVMRRSSQSNYFT